MVVVLKLPLSKKLVTDPVPVAAAVNVVALGTGIEVEEVVVENELVCPLWPPLAIVPSLAAVAVPSLASVESLLSSVVVRSGSGPSSCSVMAGVAVVLLLSLDVSSTSEIGEVVEDVRTTASDGRPCFKVDVVVFVVGLIASLVLVATLVVVILVVVVFVFVAGVLAAIDMLVFAVVVVVVFVVLVFVALVLVVVVVVVNVPVVLSNVVVVLLV